VSGLEILERAMKRKGWSDVRLSSESGVHITIIRRWFGKYGKRTRISPENAMKVARPLGISPEQILFGKRSAA
jgi:lambda repressor-like predicted transcriptional regulator